MASEDKRAKGADPTSAQDRERGDFGETDTDSDAPGRQPGHEHDDEQQGSFGDVDVDSDSPGRDKEREGSFADVDEDPDTPGRQQRHG